MRFRIYFKHHELPEKDWAVKEVEAEGVIYRVCDDHGRVVFGEPWPKKSHIVFPPQGREPGYYA